MIREHDLDRWELLDLHLPAIGAYDHRKGKAWLFGEITGAREVVAIRLIVKIQKPLEVRPSAVHAVRVLHG